MIDEHEKGKDEGLCIEAIKAPLSPQGNISPPLSDRQGVDIRSAQGLIKADKSLHKHTAAESKEKGGKFDGWSKGAKEPSFDAREKSGEEHVTAKVEKDEFVKTISTLKQWLKVTKNDQYHSKWVEMGMKKQLAVARATLKAESEGGANLRSVEKDKVKSALNEEEQEGFELVKLLMSRMGDMSNLQGKSQQEMANLFQGKGKGKGRGSIPWWMEGDNADASSATADAFRKLDDAGLEKVFKEYSKMARHEIFQKMDPSLVSNILGAYDAEVLRKARVAIADDDSKLPSDIDDAAVLARLLVCTSIQPLMSQAILQRGADGAEGSGASAFMRKLADEMRGSDDGALGIGSFPDGRKMAVTAWHAQRIQAVDAHKSHRTQDEMGALPDLKGKRKGRSTEKSEGAKGRAWIPKDHYPVFALAQDKSEEVKSIPEGFIFNGPRPVVEKVDPNIGDWLQRCGQTAKNSTRWLQKVRADQSSVTAALRSPSPVVQSNEVARLPGLQTALFKDESSRHSPKKLARDMVTSELASKNTVETSLDYLAPGWDRLDIEPPSSPSYLEPPSSSSYQEVSTVLQSGQICGSPTTRIYGLGEISTGTGHVLRAKPKLPQHLNEPLASLDFDASKVKNFNGKFNFSSHSASYSEAIRKPSTAPPPKRRRNLYESP